MALREVGCPVSPSKRPCLDILPNGKVSTVAGGPECGRTGKWCEIAEPIAPKNTRPVLKKRLHVPGELPLLPHDIDAEEAYLSCCFLGFEIPWDAKIRVADFYRERNAWVFEAMLKTKVVDPILVAGELRKVGRLDDVGGMAFLAYLITRAATPFHAHYYAELIQAAAMQRQEIEEGLKKVQAGYEGKAWGGAVKSRYRGIPVGS